MLVLYAEDDFEDLETFCEVLRNVDSTITCLSARNGAEALEMLDSGVILPDYIFLDINMPVMDGRACLKEIKKDERFNSIPVVIYTTSHSLKDRQLCMELGAAAYLHKANTFNEAVETISGFLKARK